MTDSQLIDHLNRHPALCERVKALMGVVENAAGDCTKADAAEQAVIEELRKMGNEALQSWAESATERATEALRTDQPGLHGNGKKKSTGTRPSEKSRL